MSDEANVYVSSSERQAIVCALAHLSLERPGWEPYLRTIAADRFQAEAMFQAFRRTVLPQSGAAGRRGG